MVLGWVWWVLWFREGDGSMVGGSVNSWCHELFEMHGLNSLKCHKVEKISGSIVFGWVSWVWWVTGQGG